jgi:tRNA-dihydrouridine synthase
MQMFPAAFSIRDKQISPGTVLAPMAGVTDTVFRRMIRSLGGCGLIMTEFTSAECITRNNARTSRYLFFAPDEHPITGQLFGAEADVMGRAAGMVNSLALTSWTSISAAPREKWSNAEAPVCCAI